MIAFLANTRVRSAIPFSTIAAAALLVLAIQADPASQSQTTTFTLYSPEVRRSVVVRTGTTPETIALDQLAGTFGLTLTEDRAANGLAIATRGERIFAFPGQNFVRAAGRVVVLDGPVQRDRNAWIVPLDFLTKALGPAIGQPIVVRRSSRLILVGNVRVPEIGGRVERTPNGARVLITVRPPTPYRATRDGNRLTVRFDATGLDPSPLTGFIPEFASAARVDGLNLVIDLGASAATYRVEDDRASGTVTIDLSPPPPPPLPAPRQTPGPPPGAAGAPPVGALAPPPPAPAGPQPIPPVGALRTIVIDAGHGGQDTGAVGAGGAKEKDLTLVMARRLKTAIEGRLGLRVLLTREGDDDVTLDRRSELANNNKADVFLSLHFNHSVRAAAHGAQVYTLGLDQYHEQLAQADAQRRTVPVVGGGSRVIEPVPWDLAQLPFAEQSAWLGSTLARVFAERNVPVFSRPAVQSPMRILMGANMPAVLIELGFLSNADDEKAFAGADWQSAVVESVVATLSELRRGAATGLPRGPGLERR